MADITEEVNKINSLDMPSRYEEICDLIVTMMKKGAIFQEIVKRCSKLEVYNIIDFLLRYCKEQSYAEDVIKNYYYNLLINSNRCLVISDTHIGSLMPNSVNLLPGTIWINDIGIRNAYDFARNQGINDVINVGDLIEGNSNRSKLRLESKEQIDYLQYLSFLLKDVKTYLLLGNHDFDFIRKDGMPPKFYEVTANIELIGAHKSYVNFNGNLIKIFHPFDLNSNGEVPYYNKNMELPCQFALVGHHHKYYCSTVGEIWIPTLAYLNNGEKEFRGFVELIDEGDVYLFKLYDYEAKYVNEDKLVKTKRPY